MPESLDQKTQLIQERLLATRQYFPDNTAFCIAFSGGVDSTVLLHAARHLLTPLRVIHIHHGLHPSASQWAQTAKQTAEAWQTPYTEYRITTQPAPGESVEAWARESRYQLFSLALHPQEVLLTAQHADDQAETLLLQLLRGAGLPGLSAMLQESPLGTGTLYRPFLSLSKAHIAAYAKHHQLVWTEDPTNTDQRFDRNFLRHTVFPLLKSHWPSFHTTLSRTAQHCAEANTLLTELIEPHLKAVLTSDSQQLFIEAISKCSIPLQKALLRAWILRQQGQYPTQRQIHTLLNTVIPASPDSTPVCSLGQYEIRRYQTHLYWLSKQTAPTPYVLPWDGKTALKVPDWPVPLTREALASEGLAVNQLDWTAVSVRNRQGGECFRLPGRPYSQTLKKYLQAARVPPWLRDRIPLIFCQDQLVMVVGNWTGAPPT